MFMFVKKKRKQNTMFCPKGSGGGDGGGSGGGVERGGEVSGNDTMFCPKGGGDGGGGGRWVSGNIQRSIQRKPGGGVDQLK